MKSAKHTKYEGNPRHAKGLQILSDREYKRLAKRAASMALAAAMAASTLCAPALAVEYTIDEEQGLGTVHTESNADGIWSWQDIVDAVFGNTTSDRYNHTEKGDNEIIIKGDYDHDTVDTTDQVLDVGEGTTGLDIVIDGVDAKVEEGSVVDIKDNTDVEVAIVDSHLSTKDEDAAAVHVRGDSKVGIFGSEVSGSGTAVKAEDNATLIIGGAEVKVGELYYSPVPQEMPEEEEQVSREISDTSVIVGNSVTVEEVSEEPVDVSGTAIAAEDNASVIVNEDAAALVVGSDVTVAVPVDNQTVTLTGTGIGVDLQDNASLTVEGEMESYGEQVYLNNKDLADVKNQTTNNTGVNAADSSSVNVAETGTLYAQDSASGKSSTVYAESSTLSGTRYVEDGENNFVKVYTRYLYEYDEAFGQYKQVNKTSCSATHYRSQSKINGEYVYYSIADYPLYSTTSSKPTLSDTSTGAGLQVKDNAQANISGNAVTQMATLEDNALLKVVDEGTLAVNTLTIADEYKNPVELGGMLYLENLQKGEETLTDAALMNEFKTGSTFNAVGTGTRFATYDDKNKVMEVYHQIGEGDDRQEVEIDLKRMMYDTLDARLATGGLRYLMPGDWFNYNLNFANKSGHEYVYKEKSFDIGAFGASADNVNFLAARSPNEAIMALYGVDSQHDLSPEQMILVEQKLKNEGYDFGDGNGVQYFDSIGEYYISYVNHKYGTSYTDYSEVDPKQLISVIDSFPGKNAQYTVTKEKLEQLQELVKNSGCNAKLYYKENADGTYEIQIKEADDAVGGVGYFFNEVLGIEFGKHATSEIANTDLNHERPHHTVGDYGKEEVYGENEEIFINWANQENPFGKNQEKTLTSFWLLDGWRMNNNYQLYSFAWTNTITLSRIDPDPVPPTTDPEEPTPDPDPEEPTLILTPVPEEEEVPEEEIPLAPAPVEEIPEEETPLVDAPVIDESLEEIGEEDVPLASAPKTGDESGAFGLMAVLSGMALAVMSFFGKKKEQ